MNCKTFWIGSVLHKQILASNSLFLYLPLKSQYFPLSLPFICSLSKVERTWKMQSTRLAFLLVCLTRNWFSHHSPPFMQLSRSYGSAKLYLYINTWHWRTMFKSPWKALLTLLLYHWYFKIRLDLFLLLYLFTLLKVFLS